jgi:multidrug efflux system outer membrane protein
LVVAALRDATRLSADRYREGSTATCRSSTRSGAFFEASSDLAALQRQELVAIVELYRALGGGWNE